MKLAFLKKLTGRKPLSDDFFEINRRSYFYQAANDEIVSLPHFLLWQWNANSYLLSMYFFVGDILQTSFSA